MVHRGITVGIHPNPFGFIQTLDRRYRENKHVGWVYIMRNPAFREPLLKIGKSRRPPMLRAAELGAATAVPEGFELIYFIHASNHHQAEKMVHRALAGYRRSSSKEFFDVPLRVACGVLDQAAASYPILMRKRPPVALPQFFGFMEVNCVDCGTRLRVRQLATEVSVICSTCGRRL